VGHEAVTFVRWLNGVMAGSSQVEFRLPTPGELGQVVGQETKELPESMTGLWARSASSANAELWVPAGDSHPNLIAADAIARAVRTDAGKLRILPAILTGTALDAMPLSLC
jgi:hypothetical protein